MDKETQQSWKESVEEINDWLSSVQNGPDSPLKRVFDTFEQSLEEQRQTQEAKADHLGSLDKDNREPYL